MGTKTNPAESALSIQGQRDRGWWRSEEDRFNLLRDKSLATTHSSSPLSPGPPLSCAPSIPRLPSAFPPFTLHPPPSHLQDTHKHTEDINHRAAVTLSDSLVTLSGTATVSLHRGSERKCVCVSKRVQVKDKHYWWGCRHSFHFFNLARGASHELNP